MVYMERGGIIYSLLGPGSLSTLVHTFNKTTTNISGNGGASLYPIITIHYPENVLEIW